MWSVAASPGNTPTTLAVRVLAAEHRLYPAALALVAGDKARAEGERVLLDAACPEGTAFAPLLPTFEDQARSR